MDLHTVTVHFCNGKEWRLTLLNTFHQISLRRVRFWEWLQAIRVLEQQLKAHLAWCVGEVGGDRSESGWKLRCGRVRHMRARSLFGADGDRKSNGVAPLRPRSVVVADVREAEQIGEHKPGVA